MLVLANGNPPIERRLGPMGAVRTLAETAVGTNWCDAPLVVKVKPIRIDEFVSEFDPAAHADGSTLFGLMMTGT